MISLLGLFLMGLAFVRGLAVGARVGVLVMMVAAITLLPALLGFAGSASRTRREPRPIAVASSSWSAVVGVFGLGAVP